MEYSFGFIGCGNMGGALAVAVAKYNPGLKIAVCDQLAEKALRFANKYDNVYALDSAETVLNSRFLFLGVKPQMLSVLANELGDVLKKREKDIILVSMLAGTSSDTVLNKLNVDCPIIRIMPNTPVAFGKGIVLYCPLNGVSDEDCEFFVSSLKGAGTVDAIEENKIDAASALTGCGPAFVYMFIEALADAAVECGLSRDKAAHYAVDMIEGAAVSVMSSGMHPGELKDAVCSPGGTTIAGVHALEANAFRSACMDAVCASYEKTLDMK